MEKKKKKCNIINLNNFDRKKNLKYKNHIIKVN